MDTTRQLRMARVYALCSVAATKGTATKATSIFRSMTGCDPVQMVRECGYPDFEIFLESEYMRDAIEMSYDDEGKKMFALLPNKKYDFLLQVTGRSAAAVGVMNANNVEKPPVDPQEQNQNKDGIPKQRGSISLAERAMRESVKRTNRINAG
uniref:DNA_pol3_finger domain-containing protein n=1 Tax=Steinernema glaseri TaxID=37863 RepID=A0A1I7Y266_9BILA